MEFFCDFRSSTQTFSKVQRWRPIVWGYPTCRSNQSAAGLLVYITFFQFPSTTSRWQGRVRWRDEREKRIWHWAKRACERSSRFVEFQTQIENNTLIMLTIKATQSEHLIILYNYGNITDKFEYKRMSAHKITFPICLLPSLRESYLLQLFYSVGNLFFINNRVWPKAIALNIHIHIFLPYKKMSGYLLPNVYSMHLWHAVVYHR